MENNNAEIKVEKAQTVEKPVPPAKPEKKEEPEKRLLTVSTSPHVRGRDTIPDTMLDVILALMPAAFASVYFFGQRALAVILVSVLSCVAFELLYRFVAKKDVTINDYSAVVTGMLLAFTLPATIPYPMVVIGAFAAIIIAKQLFGGLGQNFMNPALVGRAFLLAAFPSQTTSWPVGRADIFSAADAVTAATPLSTEYAGKLPTAFEQFIGRMTDGGAIGGSLGETCAAALILGGIYLLVRRVISWKIPVCYIAAVALMSFIPGKNPAYQGAPLLFVLSGGVILGAIFMATDYTTSPTTKWGQIIYGLGCGVITGVIRLFGSYPEGVTYAILIMNVLTPLLDKWTRPRVFGEVKAK